MLIFGPFGNNRHTIGHICGFARTSTGPDTFIFMGGDAGKCPNPTGSYPFHSTREVLEPRSDPYLLQPQHTMAESLDQPSIFLYQRS